MAFCDLTPLKTHVVKDRFMEMRRTQHLARCIMAVATSMPRLPLMKVAVQAHDLQGYGGWDRA